MHQYALGIDLHKKRSVWKLIDSNRSVIWSRTVGCEPELIKSAVRDLPIPAQGLHFALEPTCGWRWFSSLLEQEGLSSHIVHPYELRLIAQSSRKTDEEDAETMAEFLQIGYLPESWKSSDEIEYYRRIVRTRAGLVQSRTRLKNRAENILMTLGPGGDINTPELTEILSLIEEHTEHIHNIEKIIKEINNSNEIIKLLMTIPSVGNVTALSVYAEVGDFSRFSNGGKLASYAGLIPRERSSGETVRLGRITKEGSKLLRTVMIELAIRWKLDYSLTLGEFFSRIKKKDGAMRARVALARKLLTIMWSMVKNNKPFSSSHGIVKSGDLVSNCLAH